MEMIRLDKKIPITIKRVFQYMVITPDESIYFDSKEEALAAIDRMCGTLICCRNCLCEFGGEIIRYPGPNNNMGLCDECYHILSQQMAIIGRDFIEGLGDVDG